MSLKRNIEEIQKMLENKKEKKEHLEEENCQGELPGRFMARKLFEWLDKRYDKEYWAKLERNWRRWKGEKKRGQRTIEIIKEKWEKIEKGTQK